jgi:uncharacterized protein YyaL (SSP411 family)
MAAYGVTRNGTALTGSARRASAGSTHGFEGKNILEFVSDLEQRPTLAEAYRKLFEARKKRVHLGRDDVQLARLRQLPSNAADSVGSIAAVPLLQDRALVDGHAAAYVCRALSCQASVAEPQELGTTWSSADA